jgi:hypothetical protein
VGVFDLEVLEKGVPDEAYDRDGSVPRSTTRALKQRNQRERAGQLTLDLRTKLEEELLEGAVAISELERRPDDSPAVVLEKARRYREVQDRLEPQRLASHLWTAAFFWDLTDAEAPTTATVRCVLENPATVSARIWGKAATLAAQHRFFHWPLEFLEVFKDGGFDVVLCNPPWGQKAIAADEKAKQFIVAQFPSSRGIFDLFRPFLEVAIRLTRAGGYIGLVLPDIVLLKNYESTRIFVLANTTIRTIVWWRQPFPDSLIDVTTMALQRQGPPPHHLIIARVHDVGRAVARSIPQNAFWQNERHTFNLFLTAEKRAVLEQLKGRPRLGDFCEIHEGVHSGNIRGELFVPSLVDASCRPLIVAGSEVIPYRIRWAGNYIRLGAMPRERTRERYANLGKTEWHESVKVLVRRTGDRIIAAVDTDRRYVSNNFFLILPGETCGFNVWGLCAFLNSSFSTWFYRTVEPREGRVFAEVKIKHLSQLPLPEGVFGQEACRTLNALGAERATLEAHGADAASAAGQDVVRRRSELDRQIDLEVTRMLGLPGIGDILGRR